MLDFKTLFGKTKLLSTSCLIIPLIADSVFRAEVPTYGTAIVSLLAANSILFYLPVSKEESKMVFYLSLLVSIAFNTAMIFGINNDIIVLCLLSILSAKLCFDTIKYCKKCRSIHKQQVVDFLLANLNRFACALILIIISFGELILKNNRWLAIPFLVILIALYIFVRLRMVKDNKTFLVPKNVKIVKAQEETDINLSEEDKINEAERMRAFFDKIELIVKNTKIYLNRDYSIDDLAKIMLTNRTYISQTINIIYGDNYRAYLNKFRVEYSLDLIHQNPNLRVEEVAFKSGFNSSTSFHGVFKAFTSCTPGDYIQKERIKQQISND